MMNKIKNTKGITLIALIITIILLLILAGITIGTLRELNIIGNAEKAASKYNEEAEKENELLKEIDKLFEDDTIKKKVEDAIKDSYDDDGNIDYDKLKDNLDKIEGVENVPEKIEDLPVVITVDGKEVTIDKDDNGKPIVTVKEDNTGDDNSGAGGDNEGKDEYEMPTITEAESFSKKNGVIDIVWLDEQNNVIDSPLSPKDHLGGLTAVKYSGKDWVLADEDNTENDWYNYVAPTVIAGATVGNKSNWANARSSDGNAYFVWIPRYAYKITYFDTEEHANTHRNNGTSTEGVIGYSTIEGMIDVTNETEKLVEGTKPINVIGRVKTASYSDYTPHPAFEFDGARAGIWVGKYESSGSTSRIKILPNAESLGYKSLGDFFTASLGVKTTYNLSVDSHMMKNIEWGAVAYLTESKYGRNGLALKPNKIAMTAGGDYTSNYSQSTTGNVYGIYDFRGGLSEYVAGVLNNKLSNGSYYDFTSIDSKYYDSYDYSSVNRFKQLKGDATYEVSGWNGGVISYPYANNTTLGSFPVFVRGTDYRDTSNGGMFDFSAGTGAKSYYFGFRVVLVY